MLRKHPPSRDVQTNDSFSFNAAFTAPLQKIKIGTVSAKVESGEEQKETRDRIDEERRHQTEVRLVPCRYAAIIYGITGLYRSNNERQKAHDPQ